MPAFLLAYRPRLRLAWLMSLGGLGGGVYDLLQATRLASAAGGDLASAGILRFAAYARWAVDGFLLETPLPLYSPDGKLPSRRWRVVVLAAVSRGTQMTLRLVRPDPPLEGCRPWSAGSTSARPRCRA